MDFSNTFKKRVRKPRLGAAKAKQMTPLTESTQNTSEEAFVTEETGDPNKDLEDQNMGVVEAVIEIPRNL